MDTLTHVVFGACIGEAFFEKGFGKKAMWWGALSQSIADIDFVAFLWMDTSAALLAHRGFTHSIVFIFLLSPVFALTAERFHRPHNIRFRKWLIFFATQMLMHLLLDLCNNYGMGLLEPFQHERFAFNVLYVADPLFSFLPAVAFWMLIKLNRYSKMRLRWVKSVFIWMLTYFLFALGIKIKIQEKVEFESGLDGISYMDHLITPAPFQIFMWYVVLKTDTGYWVSYRSIFDHNIKSVRRFHPQQKKLLETVHDHEELQHLIRFSNDFYTAQKINDTLYFNDLRFGQVLGWHNPENPFVFRYILSHTSDQYLVVQRGRMQSWSRSEFHYYFRRIFGFIDFR
jgi:inner membrane protein